ncbi:type I DNA topoisomerase [Marinobacter halodurans]|uniref:DNA topoisomerase n=1 Tax=Marinobacter halodurans TaxID=2528979 RepID=A0ABY1ZM21_9GAMM|nr:type IA DNA topoisomerase [Marinobacter halodurans]TBW57363.1 type I DNA topoisomerase [Marinobacter halodurans]
MSARLMIVESPAKAKKIQALLGSAYVVKSSIGHIRDLPQHDLGVSPETLMPRYEVSPDKKRVISGLKRLAKGVPIIATDPDREGEAIAWHLKEALQLGDNYERVTYNRVTKGAIEEAIASPRPIDMKLVAAQEARRVLDRLIGYIVSPALSDRAGIPLSAGRVQSVAVRLIVDRERKITNHTPENYYEPVFVPNDYPQVEAYLVLDGWVPEGQSHLKDLAIARQFDGRIQATLIKKATKGRPVPPRPPFVTVTMQEAASKRFGMDGSEADKAAQGLFDNGHITYHRTDSPQLSPEGFSEITDFLSSQGIATADQPHQFKSKGDAQEAHEAIRPAHIEVEHAGATEQEQQLYKLIRERALLSVMPAGEDQLTQMLFEGATPYLDHSRKERRARFLAKGRIVSSQGWRAYAKLEPVESKDTPMPNLEERQSFEGKTTVHSKKTQPPKRYTKPSLTKALESAGIGRPSTYSAIIKNIMDRGYVLSNKSQKKGAPTLSPGENGYYVVDALKNMQFMSYRYTRDVESSLDRIAMGDMGYPNIVRPVYRQIQDDVATRLEGELLAKSATCPSCQKMLIQRQSRKRSKRIYWVHAQREHAEGCHQFLTDEDGIPAIPREPEKDSCPNCQAAIKRLPGKHGQGFFWVHEERSQSGKCGHKFINDNNGKPVLKEPEKTAACLLCGETIRRLYSDKKSSYFWLHESDEPECGRKFLPDNDGEPEFPSS